MKLSNIRPTPMSVLEKQLAKFETLEDDSQRSHYCYELLRQSGYTFDEIKTHEIDGNPDDVLYVNKDGATNKTIVVGAHFDKVEGTSKGVLDNASGTLQVINLAKLLKNVKTSYSYTFALFGGEEDGLDGSEEYLEKLTSQKKENIKLMINIDCVGRKSTCYYGNKSDDILESILEGSAKDVGMNILNSKMPWYYSSDFASFSSKDIPVIAIGSDGIDGIIHNSNDNMSAIDMKEYYNVQLLMLDFIKKLELNPEIKLQEAERNPGCLPGIVVGLLYGAYKILG